MPSFASHCCLDLGWEKMAGGRRCGACTGQPQLGSQPTKSPGKGGCPRLGAIGTIGTTGASATTDTTATTATIATTATTATTATAISRSHRPKTQTHVNQPPATLLIPEVGAHPGLPLDFLFLLPLHQRGLSTFRQVRKLAWALRQPSRQAFRQFSFPRAQRVRTISFDTPSLGYSSPPPRHRLCSPSLRTSTGSHDNHFTPRP